MAAGDGVDAVHVQAIGAEATINLGEGDDTANVSSNAPANHGTLAVCRLLDYLSNAAYQTPEQ